MRQVYLLLTSFVLLAPPLDAADAPPTLVLDAGGHTAAVHKVLFTPDGKELISVSDDKTIRVWDTATGEPLRTLRPPAGKGPEGMLYAAALSPDGKTLAVGGYCAQDKIYLLNLVTGRIERTLAGHTDVIKSLAFSPDGKHLASGSLDKTARLWNVATGECDRTLTEHTNDVLGIVFSPDGDRVATASRDKTGGVWAVATGKRLATLTGHDKDVRCVAWSSDGLTLATGSDDQSVRLWTADGKPGKRFADLGNVISSLQFAADGRSLLLTRGGETNNFACSLFDTTTGRESVRFDRHKNSVLTGVLSPNEKLAATAGGNDKEIFLWSATDGSIVRRLAGQGRGAWSAAWEPNGKMIAWGNEGRGSGLPAKAPLERSFDLAELRFGQAPDGTFGRATFERGSTTAECSDGKTLTVRRPGNDPVSLKPEHDFDNICCFTLMPDDQVTVGTFFSLALFDGRTGKRIQKWIGHAGVVFAVAPSPDGKFLLSASNDQTIRVWTMDRDEPLLSFFPAGDEWIAWTPEGYYAASPGGEKLMGWQVENGPDKMASFYPAEKFRKSLYRPDVIKLLLKTGSLEKALEAADKEHGKKTERTDITKVLPPKVRFVSPKAGEKLDKAEITVEAGATGTGGHPVTAFRLLVNGRPHFQDKQSVQPVESPKLGEARMSWKLTLDPGRHKLTVLADSSVSQGTEEIEVVYAGTAEPAFELPRLYVLAIGVSDYADKTLKLNFAASDAKAVADAFEAHAKPLYKSVTAKTIADKDATRLEIIKGVNWLRKEMTQKDVGVVFFAGHGEIDADGSLYFLPADTDPADLAATAVPADQIKKILVSVPGRVVWMLDACHSGAADAPKKRGGASLTDNLVRDLSAEENGLVMMASSTGKEPSLENNQKRMGNFTVAVTEALSGKASKADGAVYLNHLDSYVTDRVKELSKGYQHPVTAKPAGVRSFPLTKP